jgi:hypothetical protein
VSFRSTVGPDEATLGSADIDRELLGSVRYDQRRSEPHPGAPELAIMQSTGVLGARLSGFTVATNTAKHSAVMPNITRLKTSFISLPIHVHLAPIFSICNSHAIQANVG